MCSWQPPTARLCHRLLADPSEDLAGQYWPSRGSAKLSLIELSNDQIHAVAAHLVVAEAIIQTRLPVDAWPEGRRYRVRVGRSAMPVQVFSRRSGDWQLDIKNPLAPDTQAVVLVDFSEAPTGFYIVPADQLRDDVRTRYEEYVGRSGGSRPKNPDSRHHALRTSHVTQWYGRWDVLKDLAE